MRVFDNPDHAKARTLFRRILTFEGSLEEDVTVIAIVHLVDSAIPFLPVLNERYRVGGYLAKPSSIQPDVDAYLSAALPGRQHLLHKGALHLGIESILRAALPRKVQPLGKARAVLLDIGGYFASSADEDGSGRAGSLLKTAEAVRAQGYQLMGIVEDTQNGHERYKLALEAFGDDPGFRVISVAESPLKSPENHLVGVAITFSIEALLRRSNIVLQSRRAGVIGFGPIGRSVAHSLRNRGVTVSVCELDPIRLAQAAAQGFPTYRYNYGFEEFVRNLNLIVSATGAGAKQGERPINANTVRYLRRGTFLASVTSQDDEIDLDSLTEYYHSETLRYNQEVTRWVHVDELGLSPSDDSGRSSNSPAFYLLAGGNAVNFRHGGVVGPAIQLLQGEIIAAIGELIFRRENYSEWNLVHSVPGDVRVRVANAWLDQYLVDSAVSETE